MPLKTITRIASVSLTDIGTKKTTNQDRLLVREFTPTLQLFAVLDGLGGQPGGEEAAETALSVFSSFTPTDDEYSRQLTELLFQANAAIIARGEAEKDLYNMGTTATLLLIAGNRAHWAHIGDCRLYHIHDNRLHQITADHNLAWELYQRGEINDKKRQHHKFNQFLSQCLGEDDIEPACGDFAVTAGHGLLLCTDGIHDLLNRAEMKEILTADQTLEKRAETLVTAALEAGGEDNIGLVLLEIQS